MKTIFRTALLVSMMSAFSSQATAQETNQVNTKTIRAMSGAVATTSLSASETALIVVDIQNEYYAGQDFRGRMVIPDGADVLLKNKKLVEYAHQKDAGLLCAPHNKIARSKTVLRCSLRIPYLPSSIRICSRLRRTPLLPRRPRALSWAPIWMPA